MDSTDTIYIKGGAYKDVKKALEQWIRAYSADIPADLYFELIKNGRGNHIIKLGGQLDNDRFYYLINYLKYPEDIIYEIDIIGYTKGHKMDQLKDRNLMVFVSSDDQDYDNVNVTTQNDKSYLVDFGGRIKKTKLIRPYIAPSEINTDYSERIEVSSHLTESSSETAIQKQDPSFRFFVISGIILLTTIFLVIYKLYQPHNAKELSLLTGILISSWFISDYKLLQSNRFYLYSFVLSISFCLLIFLSYGKMDKTLTDHGTWFPIGVLIVQRPARWLFIRLMKREPVIDKPMPTLADGIYGITLLIGMFVPPAIITFILD